MDGDMRDLIDDYKRKLLKEGIDDLTSPPLTKEKFHVLKHMKKDLSNKLMEINLTLNRINESFKLYKSVYDPHITVVEVNTQSMGHRFMGKFRCYLGSTKSITFNIGRVENYQGKDDPQLVIDGKRKALEWQKNKFPEYFN